LKERPKYLKEVFLHGIRSKELAKQGGQNFFFARRFLIFQRKIRLNRGRLHVGSIPAPGTDH